MYKKKSGYALNKRNKEAVVSENADGKIICLAKEEFASEEEFARWKDWLDNEYRREYNDEQRYKRLQKKLQEQARDSGYAQSAEQILLNRLTDANRRELVIKIKTCLTEKQFRRLCLHYVDGLSMGKIADMDNVSKTSVYYSVSAAKKKIKKFFKTT